MPAVGRRPPTDGSLPVPGDAVAVAWARAPLRLGMVSVCCCAARVAAAVAVKIRSGSFHQLGRLATLPNSRRPRQNESRSAGYDLRSTRPSQVLRGMQLYRPTIADRFRNKPISAPMRSLAAWLLCAGCAANRPAPPSTQIMRGSNRIRPPRQRSACHMLGSVGGALLACVHWRHVMNGMPTFV